MPSFQRQRGTKRFHGAGCIAKPQPAKPAIDMKIAINPGNAARDDIFISGTGTLHFTGFQQSISQVEMGKGKAGFGLDRGTESLHRRRLIAHGAARITKVIQQRGIGRRQAGCAFQSLTRWRYLALRKKRQAEQPIGLGMVWLLLQEGTIARHGRVQIAGLMLAE